MHEHEKVHLAVVPPHLTPVTITSSIPTPSCLPPTQPTPPTPPTLPRRIPPPGPRDSTKGRLLLRCMPSCDAPPMTELSPMLPWNTTQTDDEEKHMFPFSFFFFHASQRTEGSGCSLIISGFSLLYEGCVLFACEYFVVYLRCVSSYLVKVPPAA